MLQYLDKLQKEDMENLIKKREMQRGLMKDVAKANEVCSIPPLSLGQVEDHAYILVSKLGDRLSNPTCDRIILSFILSALLSFCGIKSVRFVNAFFYVYEGNESAEGAKGGTGKTGRHQSHGLFERESGV